MARSGWRQPGSGSCHGRPDSSELARRRDSSGPDCCDTDPFSCYGPRPARVAGGGRAGALSGRLGDRSAAGGGAGVRQAEGEVADGGKSPASAAGGERAWRGAWRWRPRPSWRAGRRGPPHAGSTGGVSGVKQR